METEKLSIEQIAQAIKNQTLTYNEETLNGALILINHNQGGGMHASKASFGDLKTLAATIGVMMYEDPSFYNLIKLAFSACENQKKHDEALAMLDKSLKEAIGSMDNLIGSLESLLDEKPKRNKKRTNKR